MPAGYERLIAALDIGTTKVCCLIARMDRERDIHVLGMGHRVSRGIRSGAIVNMEDVENSIRAAVDQAEKIADETITEVYVNLSAGSPLSRIVELEVAIDGHEVRQADINRVLKEAGAQITVDEREIIHAFPACYAIDGVFGVKYPIGMFGEKLAVAVHTITARPGPLRNLLTSVRKSHLHPVRAVISPYAAGMATLVEDELELGAACVDMGGGTTSVSVFAQKALVYQSIIPQGGHDITEDIARELATPTNQAERLKTLFGNAFATAEQDREQINVPPMGEGELDVDHYNSVPRSHLAGIIQPRLEEILLQVRDRLGESGFDRVSGRCIVLTGGASQLPGLRDLAQTILGKQVRIGRPRGVSGLADAAMSPAFAATVGLLHYAAKAPAEMGESQSREEPVWPENKMARIGRWFSLNF